MTTSSKLLLSSLMALMTLTAYGREADDTPQEPADTGAVEMREVVVRPEKVKVFGRSPSPPRASCGRSSRPSTGLTCYPLPWYTLSPTAYTGRRRPRGSWWAYHRAWGGEICEAMRDRFGRYFVRQ